MDQKNMIYGETNSNDPAYNLAFEEWVLKNKKNGDYLLLWQNENAIIVGKNQNTYAEINKDYVKAHQVKIVRRTTGGGAVYHDLGNLNYSFITDDDPDNEEITKKKFVQPVVQVLKDMGLDAAASGRNDILVSDSKVSGTAQRIYEGRILHHGTLLFDADMTVLAEALNVNPLKFKAKGISSVRARVGNIREYLKEKMDMPKFWQEVKRKLLQSEDVEILKLSPEERSGIQRLKEEKYDTWEWNYGNLRGGTKILADKWPAGFVEIHINVMNQMIHDIAFYGDFFSRESFDDLERACVGTAYTREAVSAVFDAYPIEACFGGITKDQLLDTLFPARDDK